MGDWQEINPTNQLNKDKNKKLNKTKLIKDKSLVKGLISTLVY